MSATAVYARLAAPALHYERPTPRAAVRLARAAILFMMLSLILLPEYSQGTGEVAVKSPLYHVVVGGFRLIDGVVLFAGIMFGFASGCSRIRRPGLPCTLTLLLGAFGVATAVSVVYGMTHRGQNFFFDWRAIALGVAFFVIYRFWIHGRNDVRAAILIFAAVVAIRVALVSLFYLRGQGDSLLGIRIPLFDGPSISAIVCASILATSLAMHESPPRQRWLWLLFGAAAMLLVALCFRRTYWAELAIGLFLLALSAPGHRLRILALPLATATIACLLLGPPFAERISSIDFTKNDTLYGEDNADHVGDLLDAWAQVRTSPVMGIGLGRSYETWHIRNWKEESVMVHNAPLHVWLKYGLLGLGIYLAYHLSLFRYLRSQARRSAPYHRAVVSAAFAYLAAQFIVSLGFTPWPYSAAQSTNLIAFLLAIAFIREPACHFQASL